MYGLQEFVITFPDIFWSGVEHIPDETVGNIDVGIPVLLGHSDGVSARWSRPAVGSRQLALPFIVAVDVREGHNLADFQHQQSLIDLGFPSRGQPQEAGHQAGEDALAQVRVGKRQ